MSRRSKTEPTHGWLISNKILRFFAWAFIVVFVVSFVAVWTIRYSIDRDCENIYKRDTGIGHYWITIRAGSTEDGCVSYYESR